MPQDPTKGAPSRALTARDAALDELPPHGLDQGKASNWEHAATCCVLQLVDLVEQGEGPRGELAAGPIAAVERQADGEDLHTEAVARLRGPTLLLYERARPSVERPDARTEFVYTARQGSTGLVGWPDPAPGLTAAVGDGGGAGGAGAGGGGGVAGAQGVSGPLFSLRTPRSAHAGGPL